MGKAIVVGGCLNPKAPVSYDPVFANNTWELIIDACQKNKIPKTWEIGDQKVMTINGVDYPIDIIGMNHDTYSDGSGTAPITFQMHDYYATEYKMNNSETSEGGWRDTVMRNTHLPAILALMPSEVQAGIREVNKKSSINYKQATLGTTADKLFLLAEKEVFNTTDISQSGEGTQYAYYAAGNSKIKTYNGKANTAWLLRSQNRTHSYEFVSVSVSGTLSAREADSAGAVAFAFCF